MMRRMTISACCCLVLLVGAGAHAAEPPPLRHNPFARPSTLISNGDPAGPNAARLSNEIALRATMVGARSALADVGGKIIRPGESVNGLRLVRVFDDRAEFEVNGNRLIVYVRPATESDDE
jgi:hypothetical protein